MVRVNEAAVRSVGPIPVPDTTDVINEWVSAGWKFVSLDPVPKGTNEGQLFSYDVFVTFGR